MLCPALDFYLVFLLCLFGFLSLVTDIWSCMILDLCASLGWWCRQKKEQKRGQFATQTSMNYCKVFIGQTITMIYVNFIEVKFDLALIMMNRRVTCNCHHHHTHERKKKQHLCRPIIILSLIPSPVPYFYPSISRSVIRTCFPPICN